MCAMTRFSQSGPIGCWSQSRRGPVFAYNIQHACHTIEWNVTAVGCKTMTLPLAIYRHQRRPQRKAKEPRYRIEQSAQPAPNGRLCAIQCLERTFDFHFEFIAGPLKLFTIVWRLTTTSSLGLYICFLSISYGANE